MTRVAIFGGGVGGLTVAFELLRRGFDDVVLFERGEACGGKSRSHYPGTVPVNGGRSEMPGEHGFRFFPGFYKHLTDILEDVPGAGTDSVSDDLVRTPEAGLAFKGEGLVSFPRNLDGNLSAVDVFRTIARLYSKLKFDDEDLKRMAWFRLKYLTSGPKRREREYENMSWYEFVEGDSQRYSQRFRKFDKAIPRTMSALVSEKTSAKVIGDISMQFLLGLSRSWERDHLLQGPSSEIWIDGWVTHLENLGLELNTGHTLTSIKLDMNDQIESCTVDRQPSNTSISVNADHYVFALPINDFRALITNQMAAAEEKLATVRDIPEADVDGWMVGAQVYLKQDFPMVAGHMFYPDSEWAITSISQGQFWGRKGGPIATRYGNGQIRGILSVIISDWETPSLTTGLSAKQTLEAGSRKDVVDEALHQIRQGVGNPLLEPANAPRDYFYLDEGVESAFGAARNQTPLLLHPIGGYKDRPPAFSEKIRNLYLASDYVQTSTQLASMEGACEAGRRAVNRILDREGSLHKRCAVTDLQEERVFEPAKRLDDIRCDLGRPHIMDVCPLKLLLEAPALTPLVELVMANPIEMFEYL